MQTKRIGQFIKNRRKELSLSQHDVADFLNVAIPTVSKWENDERIPDLSFFSLLARLLKVDIESLINCTSTLNNKYDLENIFDIKRFSKHFSYLRKKNDYTLSSLANKLNVSYQTISKWENEESTPNIYVLIKCARLFNVSLAEIYYGKEFIVHQKHNDKKNSKILYVILTCFLSLTIIIASAFWLSKDETPTFIENHFDIAVNDQNSAIISEYSGDEKTIVIPANVEHNNKKVEVSELAFNLLGKFKNVEQLTIPFVGKSQDDDINGYLGYLFGATSFEFNEFVVPKTLKKIVITNATNIHSNAFYNCKNIETIILSEKLQNIGEDAFLGCDNIKYNVKDKIKYLGTSENKYFALITYQNQEDNKYIINSKTKLIAANAFFKCKSFSSISIPKEIKYISSGAFAGTMGLKDVYYEGTIADWCTIRFYSYQSNPMYNTATSFYLKNEKGEYIKIEKITIPDNITTIGKYQFDGFDELSSVFIGENVISIEKTAFGYCKSLTTIFIPKSVIKMEQNVFLGCENLTIYCEATEKPKGLDDEWNNNLAVYWGNTKS